MTSGCCRCSVMPLGFRTRKMRALYSWTVWIATTTAAIEPAAVSKTGIGPLCGTDHQPGAVSPPQRHLREANVLRPAKLEHAVQRGGSNGHLGRLPASGP